jgi:hypothetical protein
LFDNALISNDERVVNALRSLLMIVTLTAPETPETGETGPLRKLQADVRNLNSRINNLERGMDRGSRNSEDNYQKYKRAMMADPYSLKGFNPIDLTYNTDLSILDTLKGLK